MIKKNDFLKLLNWVILIFLKLSCMQKVESDKNYAKKYNSIIPGGLKRFMPADLWRDYY